MLKEDFKNYTEKYMGRYLEDCEKSEPPDRPFALVIMGQPGSGAHRIVAKLCAERFGDNPEGQGRRPAIVCEEDFMYSHRLARKLLARHLDVQMEDVSGEASRLEKECLRGLVGAGRDILWVTKGEDRDITPNTIKIMQLGGYRLEVVFLAVPGRISAVKAIVEYEWLKRRNGLAFIPSALRCLDSIRSLAQICYSVEKRRLADRIRVLDGTGMELCAYGIPAPTPPNGKKTEARGAILREQTRELTEKEYRGCLEMIIAAASGMDNRNAPSGERYIAAGLINRLFSYNPEALYLSRVRVAKNPPHGLPQINAALMRSVLTK
jgi:hypothetical protein